MVDQVVDQIVEQGKSFITGQQTSHSRSTRTRLRREAGLQKAHNRNMIRAYVTISGKVQGVFFRAHTENKANTLGNITGWVANEADGTVKIVAEGPENKINDLVDWCYSGPSGAQVEKVEVVREPYTGEYEDFAIRY
jgi:acylphosphatase